MLDKINFSLVMYYPYQLIDLYCQVAKLVDTQIALFEYILVMTSAEPSLLNISPATVAAAALLLVIEQYNLSWTKSVTFWTAVKPRQLYDMRGKLVDIWNFYYTKLMAGTPMPIT